LQAVCGLNPVSVLPLILLELNIIKENKDICPFNLIEITKPRQILRLMHRNYHFYNIFPSFVFFVPFVVKNELFTKPMRLSFKHHKDRIGNDYTASVHVHSVIYLLSGLKVFILIIDLHW